MEYQAGGSWAQSPCLSAEPTMAKERPSKLIHFVVEVGGARASEGDQGVRGSGRERGCVLDIANVRLMPAPDQQAVCSQMNGSSFNSWLCLH